MHARWISALIPLVGLPVAPAGRAQDLAPDWRIPDTGQIRTYGDRGEIPYPAPGADYDGQDGQYAVNPPQYRDNGDGTVTDLVSGLQWQKTPDFAKRTQDDAGAYAAALTLAGHDDWRLPSITELFSIADLRGNMRTHTPYCDPAVFDFRYPVSTQGERGRPGERDMDAQYASATRYLGITMGRDRSAFGFNFADGRIKSYPLFATRYVRCVRGNPRYGTHCYHPTPTGTVTDAATGLEWQQADSGTPMDWKAALAYAEGLTLAGHDDWRLPSVKELQALVDYGRAPDATDPARRGPAIDPVFRCTVIEHWCWSSTTHVETQGAYYVCFGQAASARLIDGRPMNAHGAGAVRSDPKSGDPARWPGGLGPQADAIRIRNYVRCVRGGGAVRRLAGPALEAPAAPARPGDDRVARFIGRLDRDGDGKVSRAEFDGPARAFDRFDRNGDGFIDPDEAPEGPPGRRAGDR